MKRVIIIILLSGSLFASAQKGSWTVGLYSGVQGQITTAFEQKPLIAIDETGEYIGGYHRTITRTMHRIYSPPAELAVRYNITDNFSVSSGIGYANYLLQWKYKKREQGVGDVMDRFLLNTYWCETSIQIPCAFRYDIRLKNMGFSIFHKLGLYMDFSVTSDYHYSDNHRGLPVDYNDKTYNFVFESRDELFSDNRKFNLLINAGVGFAYQFKSGLGLSLSGEYNIGTMRVKTFNYHLQLKPPDTDIVDYEFNYWIHNRNEYWNVLLGVTYTFKQKKKE